MRDCLGLARSALLVLAFAGVADALFGLDSAGGTFRYGHIYWKTLQGNQVEFTIEAAFTRKVDTSYFAGSAPDGFAQLGDKITMTGRQTPEFDFGDGRVQNKLVMTVTAYSVSEDWIMGTTTLVHAFDTLNNAGAPFESRFTGCCRFSGLINNADAPWDLMAEVDLGKAIASPRVSILPVISVPYSPGMGLPQVAIPAVANSLILGVNGAPSTRELKSTTSWSLADPWNVGNAVSFEGRRASVQLSMAEFSKPNYVTCCTQTGGVCVGEFAFPKPSISPGCFFRLLRTDHQQVGLTVEGWVKIRTDAGGVVLSTGKKVSGSGDASVCNAKGVCQVSLIYVKVNATHVTAGHEVYNEGTGAWELQATAFPVSSSGGLLDDLKDPLLYASDQFDPATLTRKWVHVTVVRQTKASAPSVIVPSARWGFTHWYSTYKVYVNGFPLGIPSFPSCAQGTNCQGGARAGNFPFPLEVAESNPLPGPRLSNGAADITATEAFITGRCEAPPQASEILPCTDGFGNQTALIFGGYRGASMPESDLDGVLDEWRFWNGERSRTDILSSYRRPSKPSDSATYGDPTDGGPVTATNSKVVSVLMADYNMDWGYASPETPSCLAKTLGCKFASVTPIFPVRASSMWTASAMSAVHVRTDTSGVMFFKAGDLYSINAQTGVVSLKALPNPGFYQITVLVALDDMSPRVPADFMIEVVDATFGESDGRLCKTNGVVPCKYSRAEGGNQFMPTLEVYGPIAASSDPNVAEFRRDGSRTSADAFVHPKKLRAYSGFNISLSFLGKDRQIAGAVKDWRDTNVGFSIGPVPGYARFSTVHARFETLDSAAPSGWEMGMAWTPCAADIGDTVVCLDAVDHHFLLESGRSTGVVDVQAASEMKCVRLQVVADPAPSFDRALTSTAPKMFIMGQEGFFDLHADDGNCLDQITIAVAPGSRLPPGAMLHAHEGYSGGKDCTARKRRFSWKPDRTLGGFESTVCFTVTDMGNASTCEDVAAKSDTICIDVSVARCKYALQQDQQLQEVAAMFGLDWMRLWSLNKDLMHPDYVVYSQQVVNVGHLYRVAANDRADGVAKRMGMPLAQLAELNSDLQGSMVLEPGQELCVVPNSCAGMARTIYTGTVYKDGKFFGDAKMQGA